MQEIALTLRGENGQWKLDFDSFHRFCTRSFIRFGSESNIRKAMNGLLYTFKKSFKKRSLRLTKRKIASSDVKLLCKYDEDKVFLREIITKNSQVFA